MRINLTKKDLVNLVYMQIGFSKKISENLIEEIFLLIIDSLIKEKKNKTFKIWNIFYKDKKIKNGTKPKNKRRKNDLSKKCCII